MKILIIGAKGFIGSHCVTHFSERHEIWQCDIVTDPVSERYFLLDPNNINYIAVFKDSQFDICINCSGAASVPDSIKNPQRDFSLNVTNVFKQLDALRMHNPGCKYINLSSAAVYGNPQFLPITEEHPLNPISPYGEHKKMAEEICTEFFAKYSIATCSIRVFSAYGPGLQKQLFWDMYQKSKNGAHVQLYGTGNESRDFIYISDLVHAIECIIQNASFENDIINVANGMEVEIREVAKAFYDVFEVDVNYDFGGEQRQGDPINWVADISKLLKLGYKNQVSLKEGINNYWQWLDANE
jgi:UDP-glucose 4-epimerase